MYMQAGPVSTVDRMENFFSQLPLLQETSEDR
jgi:hypothetical protein